MAGCIGITRWPPLAYRATSLLTSKVATKHPRLQASSLNSCVNVIPFIEVGRMLRRKTGTGEYNESNMAEPIITIDPEIGTRVPFKNLIDYLEGSHSLGDFLEQFPTVTREMAIQALEEAKESLLARIA